MIVCVEFMVDKIALEDALLQALRFPLTNYIPPILCHLSSVVIRDTHEATVSPHFYHHKILME
jgi:hypothetical protein